MTEPEAARLTVHVTLRDVVFLVGIGLAVHLLLPQLGGIRRSADAVPHASLPWLAGATAAFLASVAGGGAALRGATTLRLSPAGSAAVAFAATAVGHLSPGGVAGLRIVQRYLEHAGADRDAAISAVALVQVAQVVVTVVALVASVLLVGTTDVDPVHLPGGWVLVAGVAVVLVVVGVVLGTRLGHQRLVVPARTAARSALAVLGHPKRAALLLGGTAVEVLALGLGLAACLEAFSAGPPLVHVLAIYLVATVVGTISPTPGGVGAFEATVAAGLTGLGVPASAAVPGVLAFRLLTFWLPIPAGAALVGVLRHERAV